VTQCGPSEVTCTSFVAAATCNENCHMTLEETIAGADSSPPTTNMSIALNQRVRRQTWPRLLTGICALSNPTSWKVPQLSRQGTKDVLRKIALPQPIVESMDLRSSERFRWITHFGLRPCSLLSYQAESSQDWR
jgi:hypothetical protein